MVQRGNTSHFFEVEEGADLAEAGKLIADGALRQLSKVCRNGPQIFVVLQRAHLVEAVLQQLRF